MTIKTLKNKADKLFQEVGRKHQTACCICGGEYSCLHHFIHKSHCTSLRWDMWNGVPVCHRCHCRIHAKNDPMDIWKITAYMTRHYPQWPDYLRKKRNEVFKPSKGRMEEVIKKLEQEIDIQI